MRVLTFLLLLTVSALAQPAPSNSSLPPASQRWMGDMFAFVRQCAAPESQSSEALERANQPTIVEIKVSDGAVSSSLGPSKRASSSGDTDLDRRAVECVATLPPGLIAEIPEGKTLMFPFYWRNYATVANAPPTIGSNQQSPTANSGPLPISTLNGCRWYPPRAIRLNEEGTTTLSFKVTAQGTLTDIAVQDSSGFEDLDLASVACAQIWRYRPAMQGGTPVEAPWKMQMAWRLGVPPNPIDLSIVGASRSCAKSSLPGSEDPDKITSPTVILLTPLRGSVALAWVVQMSGNATLDKTALECVKNLPPELLAKMSGNHGLTISFPWHNYQSW